MSEEKVDKILQEWFGVIEREDQFPLDKAKFWFAGGELFDKKIQNLFSNEVEQALNGGLESWEKAPQSILALILLLDQFPRNIFRGTPRAFAGDDRALSLVLDAVDEGMDEVLFPVQRYFLYMPLMHSEDLDVQRMGLTMADVLLSESPESIHKPISAFKDYMQQHHDIIKKFGLVFKQNDLCN